MGTNLDKNYEDIITWNTGRNTSVQLRNNGPIGVVYSDVNKPVHATSASGIRTGQSESKSYCGWLPWETPPIEAGQKERRHQDCLGGRYQGL